MVKIVLGVIVGFIVWSIIWVGSEQILVQSLSSFREQHLLMEKAIFNHDGFSADVTMLLINIARSVIASILAGFLAAVTAGENRRTPLALGVVLLIVGIVVEGSYWNYIPVWYHAVFLILLIPATMAGAKLKRVSGSGQTA